jgi:hypothetical protein
MNDRGQSGVGTEQSAESKIGIKLMRMKVLGLSLCAMFLAFCIPAAAQQPTKIPRIGYLENGPASGNAVLLEAFRQELSRLGWIEGKTITFDYRFGERSSSSSSI